SSPGAGFVTPTPYTPRRPRTTCTSLMSGTPRRMLGVSPRRAATIAFVARFFAPRTSMRPRSGLRPRTVIDDAARPTRSPDLRASLMTEFMRLPCLTNGEGPGEPACALLLEPCDFLLLTQGETDVVEALEQAPPSVIVDLELGCVRADSRCARGQVDGGVDAGVGFDEAPELLGV